MTTIPSAPAFARYLGCAPILLAMLLLQTEHLVHYPVAVMALLGIHRMIVNRAGLLRERQTRALAGLFLCLWLPMLVALPDANKLSHALTTTLLYAHFFPAAYFILVTARKPANARIIAMGASAIVAFWLSDALLQWLAGRDLLGYPYDGTILKGAFYPKQRLGLILAVFAPVLFVAIRAVSTRWRHAWLLLLPFLLVMLLSLKRTAWIMLLVAMAGFFWCFLARDAKTRARRYALPIIIVVITAASIIALNPGLRLRAADTLGVFSTDYAAFDRASSYRLSLWRTGYAMFRAHWFNGVGPRGFRYLYNEYAPADDFWIQRQGHGQTHPHLQVIEIAIETGVVGLAGYVIFLLGMARQFKSLASTEPWGCAWLLAAVVACFPLNAHLAFYGSYWATLLWLLLPLGLARSRRY